MIPHGIRLSPKAQHALLVLRDYAEGKPSMPSRESAAALLSELDRVGFTLDGASMRPRIVGTTHE